MRDWVASETIWRPVGPGKPVCGMEAIKRFWEASLRAWEVNLRF